MYKKYFGDKLYGYFAKYFGSFTKSTFLELSASTHQGLRDVLPEQSVLVKERRNTTISTALRKVAQGDLFWPDADPGGSSYFKAATFQPNNEKVLITSMLGEFSNSLRLMSEVPKAKMHDEVRSAKEVRDNSEE